MGVADTLSRLAVRHAHVLLVEAPGHWLTRVAVERYALRRGWRPALSPADADILAVCGPPGPELAELVARLWDELPGPRARADIDSPDAVPSALAAAEADLLDVAGQRADSRDRPTGLQHGMEHAGHGGMEHEGHGAMGDGEMRHGGHAAMGRPGHGGEEQAGHEGMAHEGHGGQAGPGGEEQAGHEAMDHGGHEAMAHGGHGGQGGEEHAGHGEAGRDGPSDMKASGPAAEGAGHEGMDHGGHEAMEHGGHEAMEHAGHGGMAHGGHGGMDHGGMDMAPAGIPLAQGGEDRDGLEMDVLHVALGPVLPYWPANLVLRCALQGDVITDAQSSLIDAGHAGHQGEPAGEREYAARRCDNAANLLALAGWADAAVRARHARDALLDGDPTAATGHLDRLRRTVRRSWLLRWSLRRLGPLTGDDLTHHGLADRLRGDAWDRLLAVLDTAAGSIAGRAAADQPPAVPVEALADLVRGWDLGTARLIVASLDLDPLTVTGEVSHV